MADSSSGVTPLEAAARSLWEGPKDQLHWPRWADLDNHIDASLKLQYLAMARRALSAAIDALPESLDTGTVWDNQLKTESRYEDHEGESVYVSRLRIVKGSWLRRAFGLGDQP